MLKRCGRRLLLALAGALLACLLVLTADPPPPPPPAERGRRALRSLAGPVGVAPAPGLEAAAAPGALAREVHSLSEYFSRLTRARRDAGPPPGGAARPADGHPRPQAEPLAPHDVFIAVKTTKKFHRARLDLLLETWISRHKEMVSPAPGDVCGRPRRSSPFPPRLPGGPLPRAEGEVGGPPRPPSGAQGAMQTLHPPPVLGLGALGCSCPQTLGCIHRALLSPGAAWGIHPGPHFPGRQTFLRGGVGDLLGSGQVSPRRVVAMGWEQVAPEDDWSGWGGAPGSPSLKKEPWVWGC